MDDVLVVMVVKVYEKYENIFSTKILVHVGLEEE